MLATIDTGEFLRAVLPSEGVYFAAHFPPNSYGRHFNQDPCWGHNQLTATLRVLAQNRQDAYFALASYHNGDNRTGSNTKLYRAAWTDIDVGKPGAYTSQKEAITTLLDLCHRVMGIVGPTILVNSGYGVHAYWSFTRDIAPEEWQRIAQRLRALEEHAGLKADHNITVDAARVLRPVGTYNFKRPEEPQPVKGSRRSPDLDPDDFLATLTTRCDALGLDLSKTTRRVYTKLEGDLADLVAGIEQGYPPADAEKIADACAVLGEMRATKGQNQSYHTWYASLLVLAKTVQGAEVAHAWSSGHEDYDPSVVDTRIERINGSPSSKPATCGYFRLAAKELCATCPLTINSPISLGFPERATFVPTADPDKQGPDEVYDPHPDILDTIFGNGNKASGRYRFNNFGLQVRVDEKEKAKKAKAKPEASAEAGDDAPPPAEPAPPEPTWQTCSRQFPVVDFLWHDSQADEYYARIRARIKYKTWTEADLRLAVVGQGGTALMRDLAAKARVLSVGSSAPIEWYMKTWIDHVQQHTDTQHVRNNLGWQRDHGFLLGKTYYPPEGDPTPVAVGRQLAGYVGAHIPRGNWERFTELMNKLYNRPGYVAHQFALLASLGSPLLHLVWPGPVGIPLVMWSKATGLGKSTLAKVGIAMWGDPHGGGQSASATGTTELAFYTMAGQRHHLPVLLDETSPWEGQRLSDFVYRYSDGTPKQQAKAEGGLRDNSHISWCNMIFVTSNKSVISMIETATRNAAPQIARVFEVQFPDEARPSVTDQPLLDELFQHTGTVGARFIKAVSRADIRKGTVQAVRQKVQELHQLTGTGTEARYWVHLAAVTLVAGKIAQRLKLHQFDLDFMQEWACERIVELAARSEVAYDDAEDTLSDMLRDLYPGMLITLTEGRGTQGAVLAPNTYPPRGALTGRVIVDQGILYLAAGAVNEWCAKHGIDTRGLATALKTKKCLTDTSARYYLSRGTSIPGTTRVRCWALQGAMVSEALNDLPDNVIQGQFRKVDNPLPEQELPVDAELDSER